MYNLHRITPLNPSNLARKIEFLDVLQKRTEPSYCLPSQVIPSGRLDQGLTGAQRTYTVVSGAHREGQEIVNSCCAMIADLCVDIPEELALLGPVIQRTLEWSTMEVPGGGTIAACLVEVARLPLTFLCDMANESREHDFIKLLLYDGLLDCMESWRTNRAEFEGQVRPLLAFEYDVCAGCAVNLMDNRIPDAEARGEGSIRMTEIEEELVLSLPFKAFKLSFAETLVRLEELRNRN